jgi:hypothetical protein
LNLFVGLSIFVAIIMLSICAGVILSQGMCHWLLDEDGSGWQGAGTSLRQWMTVTFLLLMLMFWSRMQFPATPGGGVALTALGGWHQWHLAESAYTEYSCCVSGWLAARHDLHMGRWLGSSNVPAVSTRSIAPASRIGVVIRSVTRAGRGNIAADIAYW